MRTFLLSALVWMAASHAVAADPGCTEHFECWPETSANYTAGLHRQTEAALRKELQQRHDELVALVSSQKAGSEYLENPRLVEAVQAQQKAWQQFKEIECELIASLSGGAYSWQSVRAAVCERNLTSQRLKRTRHAIRCIRRIAPEYRNIHQQDCLYQLAPLAVPLER